MAANSKALGAAISKLQNMGAEIAIKPRNTLMNFPQGPPLTENPLYGTKWTQESAIQPGTKFEKGGHHGC